MAVNGFFSGTDGVDDDDVLGLLDDASPFDTFMFKIDAGAADVWVSIDGTTFQGPIALSDVNDTSNDPVIVMAEDKLYGLRGVFKKIRVDQNGGTAATGLTISYGCI